MSDKDELEKLGDNMYGSELAELIKDCIDAARLVEKDGASYAHMPDFFRARGAILAWHNRQIAAAIQAFGEGLFPEYDKITNPYYSFIISKKELDAAIQEAMQQSNQGDNEGSA